MSPRLKLVLLVFRLWLVIILLAGLFNTSNNFVSAATQIDIVGPQGSEWFGSNVTVLPNGNLVVVDYGYDSESNLDVGAVYLYDGESGEMISMLTGSTAYDRVGNGGVIVLTNGNFVIRSPEWNNLLTDVGAVTWGNQTIGVNGVVSADNSLIGTNLNDRIGSGGIHAMVNGNYVVLSPDFNFNGIQNTGAVTWGNGTTGVIGTIWSTNSLVGGSSDDMVGITEIVELTNGNFVISSPYWDNGAVSNAGAVTWADGTNGITGVILASNSLVGSSADDSISGVVALENGNYVVYSQNWDNGGIVDAGMVTLANGTTGTTGVISPVNSLVGTTANDKVGSEVITLSNGNFVVRSPFWDHNFVGDAGAVTWIDGNSGIKGEISETNSLIGSNLDDMYAGSIFTLSNGTYVVMNPYWDNDSVVNAGAVTWGNGSGGAVGVISSLNSLVGSSENDNVGGITELNNNNFIIYSPNWDNGAAVNAGAVTWGSGAYGISDVVSSANSLVGTAPNDMLSGQISAFKNGNFVVCSSLWDHGSIENAGAVTWGNGTTGISGEISPINSLVGSTMNDLVGVYCVTELSNSNYVVSSFIWDNGLESDAGAATWGNGTTGISGEVSSSNSLVGIKANDKVSLDGITILNNGNYVVLSSEWDNGAVENVGAVTWGNGTNGISGVVSSGNSLVGNKANDQFGYNGVTPLTNGNYVIINSYWDNDSVINVGAVTWGNGSSGVSGLVSPDNSLIGSTAEDRIGNLGITPLNNGNYVVGSPNWDNDSVLNAGAVTWGNGTNGTSGVVSSVNSLVGSSTDDQVGYNGLTAFINGDYGFKNNFWDNASITNAGAVTWGDGTKGAFGPVTTENSVVGTTVNGGQYMNYTFDPVDKKLVVGRRADHIVTLFFFDDSENIYLPLIVK